jgi:hypothetical protein
MRSNFAYFALKHRLCSFLDLTTLDLTTWTATMVLNPLHANQPLAARYAVSDNTIDICDGNETL